MPILRKAARHLLAPSGLPGLRWRNLQQPFLQLVDRARRPRRSVPRDFFEVVHADSADPWNTRVSAYELEKYQSLVNALPAPRFGKALEIGCSVGTNTRGLAEICEQLLAIDIAEAALNHARAACAGHADVAFERMQVPLEWPDGTFDLILLSEILYYLEPKDIRLTAAACQRSLTANGSILLVNFLFPNGCPCTGDQAAAIFIAALPEFRHVPCRRTDAYRIDLLQPAAAPVMHEPQQS